MIRLPRRALLAGAAAFALGVASPALAAEPAPLRIGKTFLAGALDPAEGSAGWALVSHGIAEQLFMVSREGVVVPRLAESAVQEDDGAWIVTLADGRSFSDGSPVDAQAVAAALTRTSERNPAARASAGRLAFAPIDDRRLRVTSEEPTAILPSILAEWVFPIYRETQAGIVFTGPYRVTAFEPGASLALEPNPHHEGAEARVPIALSRIADGQSLALALRAGELDLAFNLPVETLGLVAADPSLTVRSFPVAYQYMMWMDTREGPLADVRVRRAIDLALSREDLVRAIRGGIPATGAFAPTFPFAAEAPIAADLEAARALLEEAGWRPGSDGVRAKDGARLALSLVAYPQRPDLVTLQPVIRAALAELGIAATTRVTEDANGVATSGDFDLLLWAQHTAPAGDPAHFLALFFETGAARNYAGFSSEAYDALVAELRATQDPAERVRLARAAQALIAEEAPVAFLVTPEWHVGLSARLAGYEPWGSDYYVIRPDLKPAD